MSYEIIHHSKVVVLSSRNRKKFCPIQLEELKDSILGIGLLQLPIMKKTADGNAELIAGERRFRSMLKIIETGQQFKYGDEVIPVGHIPYCGLTDTPHVVAREMELHENIKRADLTWQERISAIAELHKIKSAQDSTWNLGQTAAEVNLANRTQVSQAVLLDENLHRPDVRAATSEREAIRVLVREVERELAGELGKRFAVLPTPLSDRYIIDLGDAIVNLPGTPEAPEVILTDPPYGIDAHIFKAHLGGGGAAHSHSYVDDWTNISRLLGLFATESFHVAAPSAHLYMFCDIRRFPYLHLAFSDAGWQVWDTPLIWHKGNHMGIAPDPNRGPRRTYEAILFASKGDRKVTGVGDDVLYYPRERDTVHAAQKPVDLYVELLRRSISTPGAWVLDPFCGSGPIFSAAARLKLCARGIDSDPTCVQMARDRIAGL